MLSIKNDTGVVLEVYNKSFSVEIAIDGEICISDEQINGDYELFFKYFALDDEKSHLKSEWKIRSFGRRRLVYDREKEYDIPVVTVVNVKRYEKITVEKDNVESITVLPFMISKSIKKVKCKSNGKKLPCSVEFIHKKSKPKFIIHSVIGFILKLFTLFLLIGVSIVSWIEYNGKWEDVAFSGIISVISLMLAFLWIGGIRALVRASKFKAPDSEESDE